MPLPPIQSPRPLDHLVLAVRDLDAAREAFVCLGFTLTPVGRHPFGTKNTLVVLDGTYVELLAVADPIAIPEPTPTDFSFGAFNRDFLAHREGPSMFALKSADPAADRAAFAARNLPVYDPFDFSRKATGPDGTERLVAFSLTYTSDARMPDAGFFTCQHRFPENLWLADYQHHPNGARSLAAVYMAARDPADIHEFLTYFTGQHDMRSDSLGIDFDLGNGHLQVLSPVGARAFLGVDFAKDERSRFIGLRIAVGDLAATEELLLAKSVTFAKRLGGLVIAPADAAGAAIAFVSG